MVYKIYRLKERGVFMKINSIQNNNTTAFQGFRVNSGGAMRLAKDFAKNPELEDKFIKTIVEPLKNTNTDVLFDGYVTFYKRLSGRYDTIIQAYKDSNEYIVRAASGPSKWARNIFRSQNSKPVEPVKEFSEYPYNEIEAAKNIALNIAHDADKGINLSQKMEPFFIPNDHPLAQKMKELLEKLS